MRFTSLTNKKREGIDTFVCTVSLSAAEAPKASVKDQEPPLPITPFCFRRCYMYSQFFQQFNTIICNFLWNGPHKITRSAASNDIRYGGLNLIDLVISIRSPRLVWLGRRFSRGSIPWKAYINHLLGDYGRIFFFRCNYDIKEHKINSTFMMSFSIGGPRIFLPSLPHFKVLSGTSL